MLGIILEAAKCGNIEALTSLIEQKTSLAEQDEKGKTPLLLAAEHGQLAAIQLLLKHGSSLKEADKNGNTALLLAAANGRLETVQWLLQNGSSLHEKDEEETTALLHAALAGQIKVLQWLLQNGATLQERDKYGDTALLLAAFAGQLEAVQWLLKNGASLTEKDKTGRTALLIASATGQLPLIQWLLQNGASLSERDESGKTAWLQAANNGRLTIMKWLLKNGSTIIEKKNNYEKTVSNSRLRNLSMLEDKVPLVGKDKEGNTALLLASANGHLTLIQWLLQNDSHLSEVNSAKENAFSVIVEQEPRQLACKFYIAFLYLLEASTYQQAFTWLETLNNFTAEVQANGFEIIEKALAKGQLHFSLEQLKKIIGNNLRTLCGKPILSVLDVKLLAKKILYLLGQYLFTSMESEEPVLDRQDATIFIDSVPKQFSSFANKTKRKLALLCLSFVEPTPEVVTLRYQLFMALTGFKEFMVGNTALTLNVLWQQLSEKHSRRVDKYFYKLIYALFKQHYQLIHTVDKDFNYFMQLEPLRSTTWLAELPEPIHFYQLMAAIQYSRNQTLLSGFDSEISYAVYLAINNQSIAALKGIANQFNFNAKLNNEYPLFWAATFGNSNKDLFFWLIKEGKANIKVCHSNGKDLINFLKDSKLTSIAEELAALIHATFIAAYDALKCNNLLEAKNQYTSAFSFDIDYQHPETKNTLACLATSQNNQAACEWLIQEGAKFSLANANGETPLMLAVLHEHIPLALWILNQAIDFNLEARNKQLQDVVNIAMEKGHFQMLEAIFKYKHGQKANHASNPIGFFAMKVEDAVLTQPMGSTNTPNFNPQ